MEVDASKVYTWANRAGMEFFGEDVIGREAAEYFVGEQDIYDTVKPLFDGEENVIYVESRQRRKDGEIRLLAWWCQVLKDEMGNVRGAISTARDITDRKIAEEKLAVSEGKHKAMIANISDVIAILDKNAIIRYKSPNISKWFGWNPEDLVGTDGWDTVHPDDLVRIQAEFISLLSEDNASKTVQYRYKCKDGGYKLIELTAVNLINNPIVEGVLMNYHDITERRRSEDALRESEERFRLTFDSSPDAININRLEDGLYVDINKGFTNLTGYTREDAIGKTSLEINIWDSFADRQRLVEGLKLNGYYNNLEAQFRRKDGTLTTALMSARVIALNGVPHIISITRDISERKRAENLLRESENRLKSVMEAVSDGIWDWNLQTGETTFNDRSLEMFGFDPKQPTPHADSIFTKVHPDDLPGIESAIKDHMEGKTATYEKIFRVLPCVGKSLWLHGRGRIIERDETGVPIRIIGTYTDITDRIEKEIEYSQILDTAIDGFWVVDLDGRLLDVNPAAAKMLGYSVEEMKRLTINDIDATETQEETGRQIQKVIEDGSSRFEKIQKRKDGSLINVEISCSYVPGRDGRFVAFLRDITDRIRSQKALRESEEKYRATFESIPDTVTITRVADGRYLYVNDAFVEITGYSKEEVIGRTPRDIDLYVDFENRTQMIKELNENGQLLNYEVKFRKKDGSIFDSLFSAKPLRIDDQDCLVALTKDITEQKRLEEAKKQLESQLRQSQKMEAVGTLAGGIAHDFNNLLQAINGHTQLLLMDKKENDPEYSNLKAIHKSGIQASELIRQLTTVQPES